MVILAALMMLLPLDSLGQNIPEKLFENPDDAECLWCLTKSAALCIPKCLPYPKPKCCACILKNAPACLTPCASTNAVEPAKTAPPTPPTPPTPPPSPPKQFGPYGSLINALDKFTDKDIAVGQPNKILIHSGPYGEFPDVIVGIQVFYGDVPAELHGREGSNVTTCVAVPEDGIFFSQVTGYARNKDDTTSVISQLGVKNQNGGSLCKPPVAGSSKVGKQFIAPNPLVKTLELSFIAGKTTSSPNMLGQLDFFYKTIDEGLAAVRPSNMVTPAGPIWRKVYGLNTKGGLFANLRDAMKKNIDNPEANLFSILYDLESMRNREGFFHFLLCYPELREKVPCNEWIQSSNPMNPETITGYSPIAVTYNTNGIGGPFQGLGLSPPAFSVNLIDASPDKSYGFFSIGTLRYYPRPGTVPGPGVPVKIVELFVQYTPRG